MIYIFNDDFMKYLFYFLPLGYSFKTRQKGIKGLFSWTLKYVLPTIGISFCYASFDIICYVIALLLVYTLYEIGYIENDTETIKNEINPTLRLNEDELNYYENHKKWIYAVRFIFSIIFSFILYCLEVNCTFIIYPYCLTPLYMVYNRLRNKWNIILYLFQMFIRYSAVVFIADNEINMGLVLILFLIYPYPTYIQRTVKGRFGYKSEFYSKYIIHSFDEIHPFRAKYYVLLSLLSIILCFYNLLPWYIMFVVLYMAIFTNVSCYVNYKKKD